MPTNTSTTILYSIHLLSDKPAHQQATYLCIVAALKPHKAEKFRIHFTISGNCINYKGKVSAHTAKLATIKILLNTPESKLLTSHQTFKISISTCQ
jgi:hypothetical protein